MPSNDSLSQEIRKLEDIIACLVSAAAWADISYKALDKFVYRQLERRALTYDDLDVLDCVAKTLERLRTVQQDIEDAKLRLVRFHPQRLLQDNGDVQM